MDIYQRLFDYANLKFYRIEDKYYHIFSGILLNYSPTSVILLSESGLLHIPTKEIIMMYPSKPEKLSFQDDEYKQILHDLGIKQMTIETQEKIHEKVENMDVR